MTTTAPPSALFLAFGGDKPPDELAPLLLAVAAWALADTDVIDLGFLAAPRPVDGRLSFNRKQAYQELPGLEGLLLDSMTGHGKRTRGVSVAALLLFAFPVGFETEARKDGLRHAIETGPWRTRNPPAAVVKLCRREAQRAGVVGRSGRGDGSSPAQTAFHRAEDRWRGFELAHPDLHAALLDDCAQGLAY